MIDSVNSVKVVANPATNAILMQSHVNNARYSDGISFGKDESSYCGSIFSKIGGIFSWILGTIKSVFKTIFCCDCSRSVDGKASIEELTQLKGAFSSLREKFVSSRNSKERDEFTNWWKKAFDNLGERGQILIIKKHMEGWAKDKLKGEDPTEDLIAEHVESLYQDSDRKADALSFVRELKIATHGGNSWDPVHDNYVPTYLAKIADDLNSQIENRDSEKEQEAG
ncbi:MAG: hypothetical protein K940chlam6_00022 [Chlamydiae bacterium]|nr:hypothetical protein [Chlamydiota bacterium]